jgi:hypothetical protein
MSVSCSSDYDWACTGVAAAPPHLWQCLRLSMGPRLRCSCQRMARLKPALAELLLPHILADLARGDADGRLAAVLSRQARPAVLNCPSVALIQLPLQ